MAPLSAIQICVCTVGDCQRREIWPRRLALICRYPWKPQKTKKPAYMATAIKIDAATAPPSSGSSVWPIIEWWFFLKRLPSTERINMAKKDTTTQLHAFIEETTGFMMADRAAISSGYLANCFWRWYALKVACYRRVYVGAEDEFKTTKKYSPISTTACVCYH